MNDLDEPVQKVLVQLQKNLENLDYLRGDLKIGIDYDYFEKVISEQIDEIIETEKKSLHVVTQLQNTINELNETAKKSKEKAEITYQKIQESRRSEKENWANIHDRSTSSLLSSLSNQ